MDSEILINVTRDEIRVGLLEGGQVVEFYIERKRDASLVGNIYKSKVVKILPGAVRFVDIGLERLLSCMLLTSMRVLKSLHRFLKKKRRSTPSNWFRKEGDLISP
jgi:ribonuclease G